MFAVSGHTRTSPSCPGVFPDDVHVAIFCKWRQIAGRISLGFAMNSARPGGASLLT
jgi:hypothetical protein